MPQQQSNSMPETRSNQRFHSLNTEQVEVLHQVLSEVVPIHGRGNFPTLELRPRDIIIAVRTRLQKQGITVRDVRLNGSTASHVLVRDNGTSYKDLDIIFGVELPSQEEFQVIKESVLGCLLECLPAGVNRERISSATMKEAYVQKMVKVFNEYDRWSLISLSNNSGKNLELKFVSVLRRQFEFSVDSFQIILDRLLESYMQQDSQHKNNTVDLQDECTENQRKDSPSSLKQATGAETQKNTARDLSRKEGAQMSQLKQKDKVHEKESQKELAQQTKPSIENKQSKAEKIVEQKIPEELKEVTEHTENLDKTDLSDQTPLNLLTEKTQKSEKAEPPAQLELRHEPEPSVKTNYSTEVEQSEQTQPCDGQKPAHSNQEEHYPLNEQPDQTKSSEEEGLADHTGQSEVQQVSDDSQMESQNLTDHLSTELSKSLNEDQRGNEEDDTQHEYALDSSTSSQTKVEARLADESEVETGTGEQEEGGNYMEISEVTEDILASEAKNREDLQGIDCSCSVSSISINTEPTSIQETQGIHSTLHSDNTDKTPNTLDTVSPPDTQDILPAQPSLISDKKTSSPPSCKTSERLAHMVVLKHSSPKPPRRMCRKVTANHYTGPVFERETVTASSVDSNSCPSTEQQMAFDPKPTTPSSHLTNTPTDSVSTQTKPGSEPNISTNLSSSLDLTSTPEPVPDIISTSAEDPKSVLPHETASSQLITEDLCETINHKVQETLSAHLTLDDKIQSSPTETPLESKQSEPLESVNPDKFSSNPQEPIQTSEVQLSDEETEDLQTKKMDLNQQNDNPQETTLSSPSTSQCTTPPVSYLSPSGPNLSPPDFTFSPPSLSPPKCLTPQSHCLSSPELSVVSPATSLNSPPLSFSPTSSCLSSPPYLTPPMLSLSPPPVCLSPPLLCLTPPVEKKDLVLQVSSDMEPLILSTDSGEQIKEPSLQPGVPDFQLEDEKEQDYILSLPPVSEPVSFPITIPDSASTALPQSQCGGPVESDPPKADEASSCMIENKEVPTVTTDMPEQSSSPHACDSVPAVEVLAESMYGDFEAAMNHLRYRLIATRNPEEIRGGGLLKYSNLLVRDYRPASETQIKTLERYMCSRFFIDFPDVQEQQRKILSYLKNHFIGEERSKYQYLMTLRRVVDDSTVCLMGHERRQTLNMITVLALKVLGEQNIIPNTDHVTCFYQPAPYLAEHSAPYLAEPSYCSYYIPQGGSTLLYQPYPLHLHTQTGIV
ncbi:uncharacterized protein [Antennarius striatus]|uniref:uncharacterized protein isoform X2 n=1 Tax=Antennarius striatus TaxID=241820 RepID=UPI0035B49FD8